jgi:hypothetical protein
VEIILGQARRRWSEEEKRALVAETLVEGQTVHGVARRHNISRKHALLLAQAIWRGAESACAGVNAHRLYARCGYVSRFV